jgi:hypothetical protein
MKASFKNRPIILVTSKSFSSNNDTSESCHMDHDSNSYIELNESCHNITEYTKHVIFYSLSQIM